MHPLRMFALKAMLIVLMGLYALPAAAQLQPLPVFQSKGSATLDLVAGSATITSSKIDASAFGSVLVEMAITCTVGVVLNTASLTIKGSNDKTLATSSYMILPIQDAIHAFSRNSAGRTVNLYEVQPLPAYITLTLLQSEPAFCSVRVIATFAPFSGLVSTQGSLSQGGNANSARPILIGGSGFYYSGAYSEQSAVTAGITSGGALFTTSMGATYTLAREFLVAKPNPVTPTLCTTPLTLPLLPFPDDVNIKYTWVQNNGPDPIRCSVVNSEATYNTCVNNGFVIPADGGNMSIEAAATLTCVVIGAADQITGAATNVVIGYERHGYIW